MSRVEHPIDQTLGLVHYLLLTCFDILGPSGEWMPFGSWLGASRCQQEREAVGPLSSDGVEAAKQLFNHYNALHGVRQGFHRFVMDVLSPEERKRILDSVELDGAEGGSEQQKLNRLYEIRNNFTHEGLAAGSVVAQLRGMAPQGMFAPDASIEEVNGVWTLRENPHAIGSEEGDSTSVKLWPHVLFDVISQHIDETVLPDVPIQIEVFRSMEQRTCFKTPYLKYRDIKQLAARDLASLAEDRLLRTHA